MTRHSTIIAGRGARKRAVGVERKRRDWTRDEVRGVGVAAVGDALFRLGGALSGADVLRILTERKPKPISSQRLTPEKPSEHMPVHPISGSETAGGFTPSGLLADDVCRHVHQGWFGKPLWFGGVL